jgi:MoaA/NifB/PqqE/SkfB family radical SAM enzyme
MKYLRNTTNKAIKNISSRLKNSSFLNAARKGNTLGRHRLNVQIQTISSCNASCYFCPFQESWQKFNPGRMSDATYNKIIDELSVYKIGKFCPYLENEPLLDSKIFDRIEYGISMLDFDILELSTNASVLSSNKIENIVDVFERVPHEIRISFHGISQKTYNKIMGLDFEKCRENVLALAEKAQKYDLNIEIRGAGAARKNSESMPNWFGEDEYHKFWNTEFEKHGIKNKPKVKFFTYHDRAGQIARNEINFIDTVRSSLSGFYCTRFDQWVHYLYTGDLILCCMDYHRETVFGNINQQSLDEIYHSEKFTDLAKQCAGVATSPDSFICKKCVSPGG